MSNENALLKNDVVDSETFQIDSQKLKQLLYENNEVNQFIPDTELNSDLNYQQEPRHLNLALFIQPFDLNDS